MLQTSNRLQFQKIARGELQQLKRGRRSALRIESRHTDCAVIFPKANFANRPSTGRPYISGIKEPSSRLVAQDFATLTRNTEVPCVYQDFPQRQADCCSQEDLSRFTPRAGALSWSSLRGYIESVTSFDDKANVERADKRCTCKLNGYT